MTDIDRPHLRRALQLSEAAVGHTSPNPPVGAVLVRDGAVLGEGWTRREGGREHAEVASLNDCRARGHDPRGATLYVTLEPCRIRHVHTPPCTRVILDAGIARVVVGVLDPFPGMRGQSIELLREHGVEVRVGVEEEACARRILGFARAVGFGLPEVTLKAGISTDGRIATAAGESRWITSPLSREAGHRLRACHDAVLVGIGTVLADDPRLTTRLPEVPGQTPHDPVPVVLDTQLRIPSGAKLFSSSRRAIVICGEDAPERELPADVIRVPCEPSGHVDPEAALRALVVRGLHRILVEGGGRVHRALLDRGLADTLELFVAPILIPGGRPFVGGPPIETLGAAARMELRTVEQIGPDAHLVYHLAHTVAPDPLAPLRLGLQRPSSA